MWSWLLPAVLAVLFFVWVITPSSFFNFLPYAIHEGLFQGSGYESEFIVGFDICVAVALFFGLRALMRSTIAAPPR
ncbi:MAG: hypothetical protein H6595_04610 [Flavobacteriales bacterium]|nr:hypothetical protein [Flavobacteriales bacterium]MCB9166742.1 hypothetical protein [Flavobacteriales bacterium]